MYVSSRHENKDALQFKIPWDKNTARGFGIALACAVFFLFWAGVIKMTPATPHQMKINTVPIEILNFGEGDGTGMRKGNLTAEGAAHKGTKPLSALEDAKISASTKFNKSVTPQDPETASNFTAKKDLASDQLKNDNLSGSANRNIGSPTGNPNGTGLGTQGSGAGKGTGFGDIDWGGGGNRVVLFKKLPVYPPGVNTSAQIKMRFTVSPDGTVSSIVPLQKADPVLERAAIAALRQWRFNPLKDNREMVGIIPITFMLR